ncbi:hypothetical protein SAMN04488023_12472 [Pedobacter rhizosphaerae]|uniref:Uncharacterized protein n=1 Tax=Pedobacter rhizosphaerae TaxID=390241 RepID=A0A1H9TT25_9SPHI|nr:hypothetical protein SAMN04488023_12472 [Pedobacter rhizosphaerae]
MSIHSFLLVAKVIPFLQIIIAMIELMVMLFLVVKLVVLLLFILLLLHNTISLKFVLNQNLAPRLNDLSESDITITD